MTNLVPRGDCSGYRYRWRLKPEISHNISGCLVSQMYPKGMFRSTYVRIAGDDKGVFLNRILVYFDRQMFFEEQ